MPKTKLQNIDDWIDKSVIDAALSYEQNATTLNDFRALLLKSAEKNSDIKKDDIAYGYIVRGLNRLEEDLSFVQTINKLSLGIALQAMRAHNGTRLVKKF